MSEVYELSDFHRDVMSWIETKGISVLEEVYFPPYRVDIYLPDFHVAIEADGPYHVERKDRERDRQLEAMYGLKIFHVDHELWVNKKQLASELSTFLTKAAKDRNERLNEKVKGRAPWI